jgi:putative transposase
MEAAKRFFRQAVAEVGRAPERVTTDGHDSYPRAIRFCRAFEEVRQFFRFRTTMKQFVPLAQQLRIFSQHLETLQEMFLTA